VRALSPHIEAIPLSEFVESTAQAHRLSFAEKGVALDTKIEGDAVLTVDRQRMQQAIGNVLSNALRYTEAGGAVIITATNGGVSAAGTASVEIADSGTGVSAGELGSTFERFCRTDESRTRASGGSGLGLAVTRGIVVSHGGTIHAKLRQPHGLRVIIDLPQASAQTYEIQRILDRILT